MGSVIKRRLGTKSLLLPGSDFDVQSLRTMQSKTTALADEFDAVVGQIDAKTACSQRVLSAAVVAEGLAEGAKRFEKTFAKFALDHRNGSGGFVMEAEPGNRLVTITFPVSGGAVRPKWKDEAVALAAELAKLKGKPFDEETFVAGVTKKYAAGEPTTKVVLAEAG